MAETEQTTIRGEVVDITYSSAQTGYTVCSIGVDGELVTLVGSMPFLNVGETVTAKGKYVVHPTFGKQFKVEYYEKELPTSEESVMAYLASGAIKGVGPVMAKRIVEKFGADTFEVLEKHPEYLADIPGISRKKAVEIGERFGEQFGLRNVMMYFNGIFGQTMAVKIYTKFGAASVDIVKRNPYILCEQIRGIGFERADAVAKELGFDQNSPFRAKAGMKYVLRLGYNRDGNCYTPREKLLYDSCRLLGISEEDAEAALKSLTSSGEAIAVRFGDTVGIYPDFVYRAEKYCAAQLKVLAASSINIPIAKADRLIDNAEAEMSLTFAPLQRLAIKSAVTNGMLIVTGGPGTGKTTVIRAILKLFDSLGMDTLLAAPTGRAAKRMTAATGREARTVHRLLESGYTGENSEGEATFARDENNPLECDALIVDEVSMCDIMLLSSLLRAVKPGTKVIFLGDSDQLPPVGAGDTLRDMISSGEIPTVRLDEVFRQSDGSMIVESAHKINHGLLPPIDNKNDDFFFLRRETPESLTEAVSALCTKRLPSSYGYSPTEDIQVITPSRKGTAGTANLNAVLQSVLNPQGSSKIERKFHDIVFREGDKVMQIKNNYSQEWKYDDGRSGTGVYNGEIGIIESINNFEETFKVNFDSRHVEYDAEQFEELEHAYAVTIHKSQGSEYPCVIIPLFDAPPGLLTRNMLYTAVTRAQERVILVGRSEVIEHMVQNDRQIKRCTGLCAMLKSDKKTEPENEDGNGSPQSLALPGLDKNADN